jgi:probable F420-dependent oxidoreductase
MRVGVTVFATDATMPIADLAAAVEERGFDSLWFPEHTHLPVRQATPPAVVGGVDAADYQRTLDPFIALATTAAVTTRLALGTGVALVAQHDPITLAKTIATLDHLANGRLTLGVGSGWNADEAADHGIDPTTRRAQLHEHLQVMQALWRDDVASFTGRWVELPPAFAWPKPAVREGADPNDPPGVPVLFGGVAGPTLFRSIAELGHGWLPIGGAGLSTAIPELCRAFDAAGRDPDRVRVVPFGTVPDAGKLEHFAQLGLDEVILRVPNGTADTILRVLDKYTRFVS